MATSLLPCMTASWSAGWKKRKPPAAESSSPTPPRTSRRKAKSSPPAKAKSAKKARFVPLEVKEGDRILFGKYSGTEIKIDGEEFVIMREEEVLGVLDRRHEGEGNCRLAQIAG